MHTERYDLADANRALTDLREGRIRGAAVLVPAAAEDKAVDMTAEGKAVDA